MRIFCQQTEHKDRFISRYYTVYEPTVEQVYNTVGTRTRSRTQSEISHLNQAWSECWRDCAILYCTYVWLLLTNIRLRNHKQQHLPQRDRLGFLRRFKLFLGQCTKRGKYQCKVSLQESSMGCNVDNIPIVSQVSVGC